MVVGAAVGVAANLCFALTGTRPVCSRGRSSAAGCGDLRRHRRHRRAAAVANRRRNRVRDLHELHGGEGGLAGGVGAAAMGLPLVFLIPAAFGVMAVLGLAAMTRTWARGSNGGSGARD
jgi:SET family sugar efflux transporter-like MFS transporter